KQVAVRQRSIAVWGAQTAGRVMNAAAARAELRDRPVLRADEEDAAVLGVGDRDRAVLEEIGIVRLVQIAGGGSGDPGGGRRTRPPCPKGSRAARSSRPA